MVNSRTLIDDSIRDVRDHQARKITFSTYSAIKCNQVDYTGIALHAECKNATRTTAELSKNTRQARCSTPTPMGRSEVDIFVGIASNHRRLGVCGNHSPHSTAQYGRDATRLRQATARRNFRRTNHHQISGDDRARSGNLRLAKPALSQLSYVPGKSVQRSASSFQPVCG